MLPSSETHHIYNPPLWMFLTSSLSQSKGKTHLNMMKIFSFPSGLLKVRGVQKNFHKSTVMKHFTNSDSFLKNDKIQNMS